MSDDFNPETHMWILGEASSLSDDQLAMIVARHPNAGVVSLAARELRERMQRRLTREFRAAIYQPLHDRLAKLRTRRITIDAAELRALLIMTAQAMRAIGVDPDLRQELPSKPGAQ